MRAVALGMVLLCGIAQGAEPKTVTNTIGMVLIKIPAGKFTMGSPAGETGRGEDEEQVAVTLTKSFWLGKTEVTQGQFKKVMGTEPWVGQSQTEIGEDNAATSVSWNDATAFCRRLTDSDHKNGKLPAGESYRLPTEAEWEYACWADLPSFGFDTTRLSLWKWCRLRGAGQSPSPLMWIS